MWYNPLITALLRSPLHGLLSGSYMLLTVTGRKTGLVSGVVGSAGGQTRAGDGADRNPAGVTDDGCRTPTSTPCWPGRRLRTRPPLDQIWPPAFVVAGLALL